MPFLISVSQETVDAFLRLKWITNSLSQLDRFHVENVLSTVGSRRSMRRHTHDAFALFNAGTDVS